jgi:hypothetical protein
MKLILVAACAAALALVSTASAQEPTAPSPSTLVEEVEIIARLPGPALWRVSTPTSQIWLIAMPPQVPQDFQWDQRRVVKALEGAREMVLPPALSVGLIDGVGLMALDTRHLIHMPPGQTVRSRMPPDLQARWEDAARAAGQDPAHYDKWRPVLAGMALTGDTNNHAKFRGAGVVAIAVKMGAKIHPLASYKVMDLVKNVPSMSEEAERSCLAVAADVALSVQEDTLKLSQAWARGDLQTLRARRYPAVECLAKIPGADALNSRAAADWAKELKVDLAKPGKVVVGTDLDTLTRKGGLLDQLKAEGLEVIGPAY